MKMWERCSYKDLYKELQKFNPEIIIFRIDFDQPELMNAFIRYFNTTNTPYILIIYDSWFNLDYQTKPNFDSRVF